MSFTVLHVNTERTWRGGERQTLWLARELQRRGHRNWLAARPDGPLAEAARAEDIHVFPLEPMTEADPLAVWRLRAHARKIGADVLHAHTARAVGLCALTGLSPLVATRRVDFPLKDNLFTRWKYRRASAVAAISSRVRDMLLTAGVPEGKITLIPSGIDPSGYPRAADRDRWRAARGFSPEEVLVVHAGALAPHKDQSTLLRAAALVRRQVPAKFLILGAGPLEAALRDEAAALDLGEGVRFLGHRGDVLEYMAMADLFVFSSVEEGLGTALLDALALGVPTAATKAGGIPDIYGAGAAELSPPRDPALLAENMLRVLKDPGEARRRVERGAEIVKRFSVGAMAEAYETLYAKVAR